MNKLPFPFNSDDHHKVVEDTGWKYSSSAQPSRGLHDYERRVKFDKDLTEFQEGVLEETIRLYDNPGYCHWSFRKLSPGQYLFTSTMDSSD